MTEPRIVKGRANKKAGQLALPGWVEDSRFYLPLSGFG
jgi:hypothetical protein